jgi:N-acyl-D-aspartate/D-glutamate deacylase
LTVSKAAAIIGRSSDFKGIAVHETVIRGGTVMDGTGSHGQKLDVAIDGDRVAAVAKNLEGERVVDASGCIVCPGFIDIHTHYDAQIFWDPALTPSSFHGVTTVIAGNCGFTLAPARSDHHDLIGRTLERVEDMKLETLTQGIPWDFESFPEYLRSIERRGTVMNFASYVGHTTLRMYVMGEDAYERRATPEEVARMADVVRGAMEAGAVGLSSSFATPHRGADNRPVPSRLAGREELEALLAVLKEAGRGVATIAVGEGCEVEDLYDLAPIAGVPITYVALLATADGNHRRLVDLHHEGWEKGREVWPQVSPRPITFEFSTATPFNLSSNPAFAELGTASIAERRAAYADPAWRARAAGGFTGTGMLDFTPRWETYVVNDAPGSPSATGRRLVEVASERGVSPLEAMLDLALAEGDLAVRIKAVLLNDDLDEVEYLLRQDHCALGLSDAGAHVNQLCDAPQATDLLGRWVRDRGTMTLETAVRRLSGAQADIFGLRDRGYLKPGYAADVVVFDPTTVGPGPTRRIRDFPGDGERLTAPEPVGVRHVFVNGRAIREDEQARDDVVAERPGVLVSPAAAR